MMHVGYRVPLHSSDPNPDLVSVHTFGQLVIALYDGRILAVGLATGGSSEMLVLRADEEIDPSRNSFTTRKKRKEDYAP